MLLTAILFFPVLGIVLIAGVPGRNHGAIRRATLAVTVLHFLLALPLWWLYDPAGESFQLVERAAWIESLGIEYHLGVDGVSILLVLLTIFLMPLAVLGSWRYIDRHVKEYHLLMLLRTS